MAIMNPLKPRMGKRMTLCIAVSVWVSFAELDFQGVYNFTTGLQPQSGDTEFNWSVQFLMHVCYHNLPENNRNFVQLGAKYSEFPQEA